MYRIDIDIDGSPELHLHILDLLCDGIKGKIMVDLMCCEASQTRKLSGWASETYVDIQRRDMGEKEKYFVQQDVGEFLVNQVQVFDVAFCLDGVEHLHESDAFDVISMASAVSKRGIFFTPLGDFNITEDDNPDSHRSGWLPEDIEGVYPNKFAFIVLPNFHKTIGAGAFFFWTAENIEQDFMRVKNKIHKIYADR